MKKIWIFLSLSCAHIIGIIGCEQHNQNQIDKFKLFCALQKIKESAHHASDYLRSSHNINIPVQFNVMPEFNQTENGLAISAQHQPLFIWSPWGRIQLYSPIKIEKKYLLFLRHHIFSPLEVRYVGNEKSKKRQEKATFYHIATELLDNHIYAQHIRIDEQEYLDALKNTNALVVTDRKEVRSVYMVDKIKGITLEPASPVTKENFRDSKTIKDEWRQLEYQYKMKKLKKLIIVEYVEVEDEKGNKNLIVNPLI